MTQYRAVIFDMDGVIVDSEPLHERAFLEVFDEMGYADTHGMDFKAYYGRSDRALWEDFIAKHHPPILSSDWSNGNKPNSSSFSAASSQFFRMCLDY